MSPTAARDFLQRLELLRSPAEQRRNERNLKSEKADVSKKGYLAKRA